MKYRLASIILASCAACLPLSPTLSAGAESPGLAAEMVRWGQPGNPDGDCKFFLADGELLISVPGGDRPHDLGADIEVINAPRILQSVQGDFTIQVQVDGRFAPGGESNQPGRVGYNGAGLVAVLDNNNVVTLARAVLQTKGGKPKAYANFEMRVNGELQRIGLTSDYELPLTGPVHLRIERRGQKILGAVSTDGVTWAELEPKVLPAGWSTELQVGVVAISTSKYEFNPRFSKLQIVK